MRIPRIYTARELDNGLSLLLEPQSSHHLARVLRKGAGDVLVLFNGRGGEYPAEIVTVGKKHVEVRIGHHREADCESPLRIHLGIAISRGDRMDWIVQKSTELGVHSIAPLVTEHTGVVLTGSRADKKLQHWRQVAISACEQCGRNRLPAIQSPLPVAGWLASAEADKKFVLHHRAGEHSDDREDNPGSLALLVGPEGGLSEGEIASAERAGFCSLGLGPRVLRTETAPLVAITLMQARWGDLRAG
jgi:16S rRNA (uracil1498-N3)-methyltransferase